MEDLNGDILRELRMADACIRHADHLPREQHPVLYRQMAHCAATALANATALAVEVLALGGLPVDPRMVAQRPMRLHQERAQDLLAHYRRRLRMAEQLGFERLCEVFRQIVHTKEWHLAHVGLLQAAGPAARFLCS